MTNPAKGKKCWYCGKRLTRRSYSKDHLIPLSRNGSDKAKNIVDACRHCNVLKGCLTWQEFKAAMAYAAGVLKTIPFSFYGEKAPRK